MAGHLAFCTAYMTMFVRSFGYAKFLIPLHLILIAFLATCTIFSLTAVFSVGRFRKRRYSKYVLSFILASLATLLLTVYLADFFSNKHWGSNISLRLLVTFPSQLESVAGALSFNVKWIYASLISLFAVMLAFYTSFSDLLIDSMDRLCVPGRRYGLYRNGRRKAKETAAAVVLVTAFVSFLFAVQHFQLWHGEPLITLFAQNDGSFPVTPRRVKSSEADRLARAHYPVGLSFRKMNVVLIIVDSLRADHMHLYGYTRPTTPFLEGLLKSGRLRKVRSAFSSCALTDCGVLSTMTSKEVSSISSHNFKVYDLLQDLGYKIYFILSGDHSSWYNLRTAYGKNIDYYIDGAAFPGRPLNDDMVLLEGLKKIPSYDGRPSFFFFHLMSTHYLGVKEKAYERYLPSTIALTYRQLLKTGGDRPSLVNRYDNGIIQADAYIERIFRGLDRKGYLDDTIVMILADHGESLGERGNFGHGSPLYQENIAIPLLIYDTSPLVYKNLTFATQTDVAPTIVDRLGLPVPSTWQGRSLLDANVKRYSYHQTMNNRPCYAVLHNNGTALYKYVRCLHSGSTTDSEELYELTDDPGESHNIVKSAEAGLIRDLREKMANAFDLH